MWELNTSGSLVNSYSGLCAVANTAEGYILTYYLHCSLYISTFTRTVLALTTNKPLWLNMQLKLIWWEFVLGLRLEEEVWFIFNFQIFLRMFSNIYLSILGVEIVFEQQPPLFRHQYNNHLKTPFSAWNLKIMTFERLWHDLVFYINSFNKLNIC